jgi:hypothetical protein
MAMRYLRSLLRGIVAEYLYHHLREKEHCQLSIRDCV